MMDEEINSMFASFVVGVAIGACLALMMLSNAWRTATINRGLAIYCPQNGQWSWIEECDK
jgi:hypothetical protein